MSSKKMSSQAHLIDVFQQKLNHCARPLIMGVLNVTPDSFSDGGRFLATDPLYINKAVKTAKKLMLQGADIIDIGGESTRPGAEEVSVENELKRVVPIVQACAEHDIPISVDTSKAAVMQACLDIGIVMLNDVAGFRASGVLEVIQAFDQYRPFLCVMHMKGSPRSMQTSPEYRDLFAELHQFFEARIQALLNAGVQEQHIILDPGFGFGKADEHNWDLLAQLHKSSVRNRPILAGLSRKSMFGRLLDRETHQRVSASLAGALIAGQKGARIIRVHDVAETYDVLRVLERVQQATKKEQ